jgi:hypothetical protein
MRVVTAHCPNIVSLSLLSLEVVEKEERDVVLVNGHREKMTKPGREQKEVHVYHTHYTTSLQCLDRGAISADLRVYCTPADPILPNDTVAFVVAKCNLIPHETSLLEALYVTKVPGDPRDESYEERVPDIPIPFVFAVGQVLGTVPMADGGVKCFAVNISEYVRDDLKYCAIQCVAASLCFHLNMTCLHSCYFDSNKPRWSRTPSPRSNSVLQFFGVCDSVTAEGILRVQVDALNLNLGYGLAWTSAAPEPAASINEKKRKFSAIAVPHPSRAPVGLYVFICPRSLLLNVFHRNLVVTTTHFYA